MYAKSLGEIKYYEKYRCRICTRDKFGSAFTQQYDACDDCISKYSTIRKTCPTCGREYWDRKNKKYAWCSEKCNPTIALGKFRIFERDEFKCIYCGKSSVEDASALEVDHIVPRVLNGMDHASNLVTACISCNGQKNAMQLESSTIRRILDEVARRNEKCGLVNRYIKV